MHQLELFVTGSEYNKLCNMALAIYMANENDPNGSISSKIHPNTCRTEREKKFFNKKFTGAMAFIGPESGGKNIFSIFHVFHAYFSCLYSITR